MKSDTDFSVEALFRQAERRGLRWVANPIQRTAEGKRISRGETRHVAKRTAVRKNYEVTRAVPVYGLTLDQRKYLRP